MKVIIVEGTEKEIAALVAELQERQKPKFVSCDADSEKEELNGTRDSC